MSSINENIQIDPRLYAQQASNSNLPTPIAPNSVTGPPQYQSFHSGSPQLHQSPYLTTSPSGGHGPHDDGGNDAHDGGSHDPKRPRACEACRGLKVRCEPVVDNPDGPCKRCTKANRNCVVTAASRKRQKKTESRVAELEKKIDALTATLHAQKSGSASGVYGSENGLEQESPPQVRGNPYQQVTNGGYESFAVGRPDVRVGEWDEYQKTPNYKSRVASSPPMVIAGQKRKLNDGRDYSTVSGSPLPGSAGPARRSVDNNNPQNYGFLLAGPSPNGPQVHEYADVVDRGVVTADMASRMFDCYVEKMAPHMPAVVFPIGTPAAEVRKNKPTLFLAILSAASGSNHPDLQRALTKEVMGIYAERIICNGEKTLELVQALLISTLWYWPPEHFEELKFYQLIHIAAVMAIDIGMDKKNKAPKSRTAGLWRDTPWRRTPYPDPETLESRRAWLACYYLCCNASMGLRRPNLIRWTPFMADCVDVLENSPEAFPSDKALSQWVRSQHIAEEVGTQFSMDDFSATVSIADSKVQYALKGFERDLEKWSEQMPSDIDSSK